VINCFKNTCRYEPLVTKIKHVYTKTRSLPDIIEIGRRYAEEDLQPDSNDELGGRRSPLRGGPLCPDSSYQDNYELCFSNTRHISKHSTGPDLVANAGHGSPRDPKTFRHDDGGYRSDNNHNRGKNLHNRKT
jgi:hypothetical protein